MLVYTDLISGDELLSDSFKYEEKVNGILWEVDGKWVQQGAIDVDIGANPSAEGGEEEGVDDAGGAKVVDIVDTFRLQEQPAFEKKALLAYLKKYIQAISKLIPADKQDKFKQNASDAVKYIVAKIKDLQYFVGESMGDDAGLVFAYYKEGKVDPTFIYFADGLKEVKC